MRNATALAVGLLALLSTGCASIIHGSRQAVFVNSVPAGATVTAKDQYGMTVASQQTPCTLRLRRGRSFFTGASYSLTVEKQGHEPVNVFVSSRLGLLWYGGGNCILGGICGWFLIDPITGAMWTLEPDAVNVTLPRSQARAPREPGGLAAMAGQRAPGEERPLAIPARR